MRPWRRLQVAILLLAAVVAIGTVGYRLLGLGWVDALYQTAITVSTVGFEEVHEFSVTEELFTIAFIFLGVGVGLYGFTALVEATVEAQMSNVFRRRRMERRIEKMSGHVVICGWGRVGKSLARNVHGQGREVVVVDIDENRLGDCPHGYVVGDATEDQVLVAAGVERAHALVAATDTDPENIAVVLSGRTLKPDLFIVGRARLTGTEAKLLRAGADRVVNPQDIGGARIAAFVLQPHVAEFLDVVMHDGSLEFRLEEVEVGKGSTVAGHSLRDTHIRDRTGALILALRDPAGSFTTNPEPSTVIEAGDILIAVGTAKQLAELASMVQRTD